MIGAQRVYHMCNVNKCLCYFYLLIKCHIAILKGMFNNYYTT